MPVASDLAKLAAEEIVRENPDLAAPLITVLTAVLDPKGDSDRYRLGWEIMRAAYTRTAHFEEEGFQRFITTLGS